jgi:hypothetical protein
MQVSLTPHADALIARMMQLGFDNPAALIEVALERMAQEELEATSEESPEFIAFMQREVAIGVEAADRGDFSTATLDELKQRAIARVGAKQANATL